jgi:DNA polymerase I-like protein with 3'-5' exonuclease and polymerase domains
MSKIKECFDSRFPNGVILNTDLTSAEVIALAILSNDPLLIEDILSGRDMHKHFASLLFKIPEEEVTKAQRTLVKRFTFALI